MSSTRLQSRSSGQNYMPQKTKKCIKCKKSRRVTQFSLIRKNESNEIRDDVCRVCNYDGLTASERHKILREAYRNYLTFKQFVTDTGKDVLEYRVPKEPGSDEYVPIRISFTDLERALKSYNNEMRREGTVLSKRKEQAFYLHVIRDMLQRDVAEIMGITTVSVGQYVEQGCIQLCDYYFGEDVSDETLDSTVQQDDK
jgi:hypothetical protein